MLIRLISEVFCEELKMLNHEYFNDVESYIIIISYGLIFILLGGTIAAILGVFKIFSELIFFLAILLLLYLTRKKIVKFKKIRTYDFLIIILIFIFSIINGYYYHETVGNDRDHGAYVVNAVALVKHGSVLIDSQFTYMGFVRAFFDPQKIVLSRPPLYSIYLAFFYSIGGLTALFWANSFLLFISLSIMYFIGKRLSGKVSGLLLVIFFITCYATLYFSRRTLSENLFLFLIWFGVLLFVTGLQHKNRRLLISSFIPISLLPLARIEGFIYILSFVFASLIIHKRKIDLKGFYKEKEFLLVILIFGISGLYYLNFMQNYFLIVIKVIENIIIKALDSMGVSLGIENRTFLRTISFTPMENLRYVFYLFNYYFITPFIVACIIGLYKKKFKFEHFIITILVFPSLLYLYDPIIFRDHPWAMRRYWPVFMPYVFLLTSSYLSKIKEQANNRIFFSLFFILISFNSINSMGILTYTEYRSDDLSLFVSKFDEGDIILFPEEYYDTFGRWSSILKFHYGLDVIWPVLRTPYQEEKINTFKSISNYLNNTDREIYVVSKIDKEKKKVTDYFLNAQLTRVSEYNHTYENLYKNELEFPPKKKDKKIERYHYHIYKVKPLKLTLSLSLRGNHSVYFTANETTTNLYVLKKDLNKHFGPDILRIQVEDMDNNLIVEKIIADDGITEKSGRGFYKDVDLDFSTIPLSIYKIIFNSSGDDFIYNVGIDAEKIVLSSNAVRLCCRHEAIKLYFKPAESFLISSYTNHPRPKQILIYNPIMEVEAINVTNAHERYSKSIFVEEENRKKVWSINVSSQDIVIEFDNVSYVAVSREQLFEP